jgi:hypothetical protein
MFHTRNIETIKTHFMFNFFFRKSLILWDNVEKCVVRGRPLMTWRMRIAFWIPKARNTHTGYVIPISFPPKKWLHQRPLMLPLKRILPVLFICWKCVFYFENCGVWRSNRNRMDARILCPWFLLYVGHLRRFLGHEKSCRNPTPNTGQPSM